MIAELTAQSGRIAELCHSFGVRKLEVFGSAVTGEFDMQSSDIDFIADFADRSPGYARRYLSFAEALENLFSRPVDLMTNLPIENRTFAPASSAPGQRSMNHRTAKRLHDVPSEHSDST